MEESDGVSSTQTDTGSDTVEGTEDTTMIEQMEDVKRAIRALPFVTELSFVRAVKYNISGEWPTLIACVQELRKRLEEEHDGCVEAFAKKDSVDPTSSVTVSPDTPNVEFQSSCGHVEFQETVVEREH